MLTRALEFFLVDEIDFQQLRVRDVGCNAGSEEGCQHVVRCADDVHHGYARKSIEMPNHQQP